MDVKVGLNGIAQEALHHLDQGVSVFDSDLNLVLFNENFIQLLEFPAEMVFQGTRFEDLIRFNAKRGEYGPGDQEQQVKERVEKAHHPTHHSYRRIRPDGTVIQIDGNPLPSGGFITTYTDITEKVRGEAFLRNIVEATPAGFLVTRQGDGQIAFANQRALALHGYTLAEMMSLRGRDLYADPMERQALLDRCLADGDVENVETVLVRKDGSSFAALITLQLADFQGHPCFFGWIIDVSRQKATWAGDGGQPEKIPVDVPPLLVKTVEETKPRWSPVADLTIEADDDLPQLLCNPESLKQALEILILSSSDMAANKQGDPANASGGETPSLTRIRLTARYYADGMRLTVSDNGAPLNQAAMASILKGTMGPGAEMDVSVEKIVREDHGGSIATETSRDGNTVVLLLPVKG